MSLSSTIVTWTPHSSVWTSRISRMLRLMVSVSDSVSSSVWRPTTARSVVWAIWLIAAATFSSATTDRIGSATRCAYHPQRSAPPRLRRARCAPGVVGGDEHERARASLTKSVNSWFGPQGIARTRVCGLGVLQIGFEDLEPPGRLWAPFDDARSPRAVEEAGLQESGRAVCAHGVSATVGEEDLHTGELAVVGVSR